MQRGVTTRTAAGPDQARLSLALWLRQGRAQRGMSVDDVAKVTKIQRRILESLEAGKFERLPADVFVRGFVRSIARCVGLDADEALARFVAASNAAGVPTGTAPVARALVDTMSELAPATAKAAPELLVSTPVVEVVAASEPAIEVVDASEPAAIEVVEATDRGEAEVQPIMTAEGSGAATIAELSAASDLEIDIVVADAAEAPEAPRRKRTRRAKGTDAPPSAPRARRKKQPTEATELVVAAPAAPADGSEAPAPKRRRKKQTTVSATVVAASTQADAAPSDAAPSESIDLAVAESSTELAASSEPATEPTTAEPRTTIVIDASSAVSDLWAPRDYPIEPEPTLELDSATTDVTDTTDLAGTWSPRMPVATPSVPWRRRTFATTAPAALSPVLTIDDSDPESAEREREDRSTARPRRSFLPPILLDRDDRGARQGGLTLAVIILLIAATLTLSYLMRRPSSSGDGVTLREIPTHLG